jgi:hypothetical protein
MSFMESDHVNNVFMYYKYGLTHPMHDTNITNYQLSSKKTIYELVKKDWICLTTSINK